MSIRNLCLRLFAFSFVWVCSAELHSQEAQAPIARIFPPVGQKPDQEIAKRLLAGVEELELALRPLDPRGAGNPADWNKSHFADVAIFPKAIRYALDYDEFYNERDFRGAERLLEMGRERLKELQSGTTTPTWTKQRGLVVRGYISAIDHSVQPYGLHIPESLDLNAKNPLYVWLHGRQEKMPDLQFLLDRGRNKGKFAPEDAIIVHPFGRYNNAFKFSGEQDVLDVMFHVENTYKTDPTRRVLMGFSMGGAGCWQIGAHYHQLFCAMSPGAGFVESRMFLRIKEDNLPPWYEQVLWQWYDVPEYTRNLFNLPVIAYSGEKDRQKQAADVMEASFAKHGRKLNHIIGPAMGHEYDDGSVAKITAELRAITTAEPKQPDHVYVQSPLVAYANAKGAAIERIEHKWTNARVDGDFPTADTKHAFKVQTKNAGLLTLDLEVLKSTSNVILDLDGQMGESAVAKMKFEKVAGKWDSPRTNVTPIVDRYEGSIDVAFCTPFLFVMPTGKFKDPQVQAWVERESAYQIDRWRRTFRGDVLVVKDSELTASQKRDFNLILWGDSQSNSVIRELQEKANSPDANRWGKNGWGKLFELYGSSDNVLVGLGSKRILGDDAVNGSVNHGGFSQGKWFVLNSGPTFRDEHDKNNANQTPKLPDWAVINPSQPGDAKSAGTVVEAAFFNDDWQYEEPAAQRARFEKWLRSEER